MRNSLLLILGKRVVPKGIVVKSGIILVSERQPRQTVRKSPSGWERRFGIMLFKKSHYKAKLSKNTGIEKLSCPPRTKKNKWSVLLFGSRNKPFFRTPINGCPKPP